MPWHQYGQSENLRTAPSGMHASPLAAVRYSTKVLIYQLVRQHFSESLIWLFASVSKVMTVTSCVP